MSPPRDILQVLLNTRTPAAVNSTSTPGSQQQQAAAASSSSRSSITTHPKRQTSYFRVIGRGTCGTIYEHSSQPSEVAIKVGSDHISMKRDFNHSLRAFRALRISACTRVGELFHVSLPLVPRPRKSLDDHDLGRFGSRGLRLEALDAESCEGDPSVFRPAQMPAAWDGERIGAVSGEIRDALVDSYVEPDLRESARADDENRDCLIRIYLGAESPRRHHLDGLRNAPLYLDQMKDLALDVTALAEEMAMGLAMCHWAAELDGMDIEFVLGAPRIAKYMDMSDRTKQQPVVRMWMLDYDKTTLVSPRGNMNKDGEMVEKFAVAAHGNDPYFPRSSLDEKLWARFVEVYVLASRSVVQNMRTSNEDKQRLLKLPQRVMERLKELHQEEDAWHVDAEDLVGFERDGGNGDDGGWASEEVNGDEEWSGTESDQDMDDR